MEIFNACARTLFLFFSVTIDSSRRHHQAAWDSREFWSSARVKSSSTSYTQSRERERRIPMSQIKNNFFLPSLFCCCTPTTKSCKDNDTETTQRRRCCDRRQFDTRSSSSWKIEGVFERFYFPLNLYYLHTKKEATEDREGKECRARRRERVSVNTQFFSVGWRFFLLHRVFLSPLVQQQRWRR